MSQELVMQIFNEAVWLAFKLGVPLLLVGMLVGLIIAILQAATQVHEQTLTFAPKVICLLYTSDAADDGYSVDLGGRRIIKKIFFKQKTAYEISEGLVGSEMCIRDSRYTNRFPIYE